MARRVGEAALITALSEWRRNAGALGLVIAAFGIAYLIGTREAYYAAALVGFTVWMVWFVLMAIDWVRLADF